MGSGGLDAVAHRGLGRGAAQWMWDDNEEERENAELSSGGSYRPEESGSKAPQFLIEADDVYDEEYGGGRLVAPPVLGEAPQSFRDF